MKKKYILIVIAIIAIILVVGAIFLGDSSTERKSDEIVAAVGAYTREPDMGYDPTLGYAYSKEPLIQSTLFKRDGNMTLKNDLAKNYTTSSDGKTWTVDIRDDVKFHDGSKLTAKDVAFTYNKSADAGASVDLTDLTQVKAVNDTQVEFTLNKSDSSFLFRLSAVGIVPESGYNNETYGQNPIGSGPYKFVQWDKGQQLILEVNEDYYGEKPQFKKLTLLFLDDDAAFAAAKKGEVDVAEIPLSYSDEKVNNMTMVALDSIDTRGISLPNVNNTGEKVNGIDVGNNVTSDESIRKALNYGIDRQKLIDGPLKGYGNKSFDGIGLNLPWSNSEAAIEDGNLEKAKKILADSGWKDTDGDGILEKNGQKASFTVLYEASDSNRQSLVVSVAEEAKVMGIEILPEGKSWDEIDTQKLSQPVLWGFGTLDPSTIYHQFYSKLVGSGWDNPASYNNSAVDQHMEDALNAPNENASYSYWSQVSYDGTNGISPKADAPWLWLVLMDYTYFVDDSLDIGDPVVQPHGGNLFGNIHEWKRVNSTSN
ncbi:HTH-type transcriptional regulator SgrR [Candidatus Methanobinarius endosymbioticus]|uniref:HTH-type transcriptional regulator SgrR n=1 Tax=Candidatus Methanobinarius endosymbioticus TaxID=2006182 RepID=A0A366MED0_9EURY|nr:HTH-type transcriptional regulator SgrR [Candidatus Methanobinarius endosymbioticus]